MGSKEDLQREKAKINSGEVPLNAGSQAEPTLKERTYEKANSELSEWVNEQFQATAKAMGEGKDHRIDWREFQARLIAFNNSLVDLMKEKNDLMIRMAQKMQEAIALIADTKSENNQLRTALNVRNN